MDEWESIARHGLVVLPRVISKRQDERQTRGGGTMFYTHLSVEFDFVAVADGSKAVVVTEGETGWTRRRQHR